MFFYTNTEKYGQYILVRGYRDGKQFFDKVKYKPTLYYPSKRETEYKSIHGVPLEQTEFDSIKDANDFIHKYENVDNFQYYGMEKFDIQYRVHTWPNEIQYDESLIRVMYHDIEVDIDGGYPNIEIADKPITAITLHCMGQMFSMGLKDFVPKNNSKYFKCTDEKAILKVFLTLMNKFKPDILSGWNIEGFDVPYIIRRCMIVLGEEETKTISPWNIIRTKTVPTFNGNTMEVFEILGIAQLDYMLLYKKYGEKQDSHTLENIAQVELGRGKIDYGEYGNLDNLYKQNPQLYMEYNQGDVELLPLLEEKKRYISTTLTVAYYAKCNYVDTYKNTRLWDSLIYNYLINRKIVVDAPRSLDIGETKEHIAGGYVKLPKGGMYPWVLTYDATSLYPSLIMSYNISPETYVKKEYLTPDIILNNMNSPEIQRLAQNAKEMNCSMAGNGAMFTNEREGHLPAMTKQLFELRKEYKQKMLKVEAESEEETNQERKQDLIKQKNIFDSMQNTLKILLNSLFGSMANNGFRYNHSHFSEAITLSGQLSIQWAERCINKFMNVVFKTDNVDYVIYCDTDSVVLNAEKIADLCPSRNSEDIVNFIDEFGKSKIHPYLEQAFTKLQSVMNYKNQKIFFKREKICDKGIFMPDKKKRYILSVWDKEGVRYHEPKIMITGIEAVRSSTPMIIRNILKGSFKKIMTETNKEVIDYLETFREEFNKSPADVIAIPTSANGISTYHSPSSIYKAKTPMHVRAALLHNHYINTMNLHHIDKIKDGEKIKFVHLKMPNPINENVIGFVRELPKEFGLHQYIDYDTQFKKTLISPIEKIFDVLNWKTKDTADLGDLF